MPLQSLYLVRYSTKWMMNWWLEKCSVLRRVVSRDVQEWLWVFPIHSDSQNLHAVKPFPIPILFLSRQTRSQYLLFFRFHFQQEFLLNSQWYHVFHSMQKLNILSYGNFVNRTSFDICISTVTVRVPVIPMGIRENSSHIPVQLVSLYRCCRLPCLVGWQ